MFSLRFFWAVLLLLVATSGVSQARVAGDSCSLIIDPNYNLDYEPNEASLWLRPDPMPFRLIYDLQIQQTQVVYLDPAKPKQPSFILEKRPEESWFILYLEKNNRHGDPRWMMHTLGQRAARLFGDRMLSRNAMLIGGAYRTNEGIETFNKGLSEDDQILARFYPTGEKAAFGEPYLEEYVLRDSIPFSQKGFLQIHDAAYHRSQIYLIAKYFRHSRALFSAKLRYLKFTRENYPKIWKANRGFYKRLLFNAALGLDITGNLMPLVAGLPELHNGISWKGSLEDILSNGVSPYESLEEFLRLGNRNAKPTKNLDILLTLEMFRQDSLTNHPEFFQSLGPITPEEFRDTTLARVKFIRNRAAALVSTP